VLSVCAARANVVYAVSPLARSEVKSQNLPSTMMCQNRCEMVKEGKEDIEFRV
jgi:hypothetical protein